MEGADRTGMEGSRDGRWTERGREGEGVMECRRFTHVLPLRWEAGRKAEGQEGRGKRAEAGGRTHPSKHTMGLQDGYGNRSPRRRRREVGGGERRRDGPTGGTGRRDGMTSSNS